MTSYELTDSDKKLIEQTRDRLGDPAEVVTHQFGSRSLARLLDAVRQEERARYEKLFDAAWEYMAADQEPARKPARVRAAADALRMVLLCVQLPDEALPKLETKDER